MVTSSTAESVVGNDDAGKPNQARTLVVSVLVTWVIMLVGIGVPLSLAMDNWMSGMAVGFHTSLFGGPGFGLMAGMALHTMHMEKWEKLHPELSAH